MLRIMARTLHEFMGYSCDDEQKKADYLDCGAVYEAIHKVARTYVLGLDPHRPPERMFNQARGRMQQDTCSLEIYATEWAQTALRVVRVYIEELQAV